MLTLKSVQAGYGRLPVLKGISVHVRAGEVVTLIGGNGAGQDHHPAHHFRAAAPPEGGHRLRRP